MDIHEHQAKELLRDYNIPTPKGKAVFSVNDALLAAKELPGPVYVVKAQIHAGGRGKAGGVKVVNDLEACLLYTSPSPRDGLLSRMPSSA